MLHVTSVPFSSSSSLLLVLMFCTVRLQYQRHVSLEIIWDDSRNPTQPQYIQEAPRGDSTNLTHTSQSYPIVSNPSVNRKQSNDRSWSDQGSASTPNNPPTPPLWTNSTVSVCRLTPRPAALYTAFQATMEYCALFLLFFLYLYLIESLVSFSLIFWC